jgi:hypothetical protein
MLAQRPETKSRCSVATKTARSPQTQSTVLEQLGEHAAMPTRSQIRRNSKGPPM